MFKQPFEFIEDKNTLTVRRSDLNRYGMLGIFALLCFLPFILFGELLFNFSTAGGSLTTVFILFWISCALYGGISIFLECELRLDNNTGMIYKNDKFLLNYSDVLSFHLKESAQRSEGGTSYYYVISIQTKSGHKHRLFRLSNYEVGEKIVIKMKRFVATGRIQ